MSGYLQVHISSHIDAGWLVQHAVQWSKKAATTEDITPAYDYTILLHSLHPMPYTLCHVMNLSLRHHPSTGLDWSSVQVKQPLQGMGCGDTAAVTG